MVIAGPTASGKSALAVTLARAARRHRDHADSMQVYADLSVLTARPLAIDIARAPHRLFGHVDAAETYSVGRWLDEVRPVLEEARACGRMPIVVGGTGLYLKALMQGLSAIPPVPADVRERVRSTMHGALSEDLHETLRARDPPMRGGLRPTDPQRILRALEVFEATGQSLSTFQAQRAPALLPHSRVFAVLVAPERQALNARIDARFDAMIEGGALKEVARLGGHVLDPALTAMRALGVRRCSPICAGTRTLAEAIAEAKQLTRNFAKRQMTFFRHQLPELVPFDEPNADAVASAFQHSSNVRTAPMTMPPAFARRFVRHASMDLPWRTFRPPSSDSGA